MEIVFFISLALGITLPVVLFILGGDHVRRSYAERLECHGAGHVQGSHARRPESHGVDHVHRSYAGRAESHAESHAESGVEQFGTSPVIGVVVPLTGNPPGMKACLESLLNQTLPGYEVIFVTSDMRDPAVRVVEEVLAANSRARHVTSGAATECCQKNHNLLAGIAALGEAAEILVFCDSTHLAPPYFLSDLAAPIVAGEAVMTTGFHRIIPWNSGLSTLGMLISVIAIHMLQGISFISQPWGGATAISRRAFEQYGVGSVWARDVVDDMSLGIHLQDHGIRVKSVPTACMTSLGLAPRAWHAWLKRQIFFLKFYQPFAWAASAIVAYLLTTPVLSVLACLFAVMGFVSLRTGLASLAFSAAFIGVGLAWRSLLPEWVPRWKWIVGAVCAGLMTAVCYVETCFCNVISWRGIAYRVALGGRVVEVIRKADKTTNAA